MHSLCSGTVANLAMARRERACIKRAGILPYIRYIDDISALIEGRSITEVHHILQELNDAVAPVQIKWNVWKRHAIYLDAEVEITPLLSQKPFSVSYRTYGKPRSHFAYLPWSLAHPTHVKKGLVIGETMRLSLLCSEERLLKEELSRFRYRPAERGYP